MGNLEKTNVLYSDRMQISGYIESETGELPRKEHEGTVWGDHNIVFLNYDGGYTGV